MTETTVSTTERRRRRQCENHETIAVIHDLYLFCVSLTLCCWRSALRTSEDDDEIPYHGVSSTNRYAELAFANVPGFTRSKLNRITR